MVTLSATVRKLDPRPAKSAPKRQQPYNPAVQTAAENRPMVISTVATPYQHIVDGNAEEVVKALSQKVVRIEDPIERLFRRGKVTQAQKTAADKYRTAYERLAGSMGTTLDPSKVGGAFAGGGTPHSTMAAAADVIAEAHGKLGQVMSMVLDRIAGDGLSIEQCTVSFYGEDLSRIQFYRHRIYVGQLLNDGLDVLAKVWGFETNQKRSGRIRGSSWGEKATVLDWEIKPAITAHAVRGKVTYGGEK